MNFQQRLLRLERIVKVKASRSLRFDRRLVGLPPDDFWSAFEAALDAESVPVVEEIIREIEEKANKPSAHDDGRRAGETQGFLIWLRGLHAGWWTLPDTMPHAVLLAWRDWPSPIPFWRCADCGMALPHHTVEHQFRPCPICASDRLFHADVGYSWGTAWIDPSRSYSPLPRKK